MNLEERTVKNENSIIELKGEKEKQSVGIWRLGADMEEVKIMAAKDKEEK